MITQPEDEVGDIASGDSISVEEDVIGNDAIDAVIERGRAGRQIAAHAFSDEDDFGWLRMFFKKTVEDRAVWLFPFWRECQPLFANDRALTWPFVSQYGIAALISRRNELHI